MRWNFRMSAALAARGYDPMWFLVALYLGVVAVGCVIVLFNNSLDDVWGGVWGFSQTPSWFLLQMQRIYGTLPGLLAWFLLPMFCTRSFAVRFVFWILVPLAIYLGYTAINVVQAVNVYFDSGTPYSYCSPVVERVRLGCTSSVTDRSTGRSVKACPLMNKLDEWAVPGKTVWIERGPAQPDFLMCFKGHAGLLGLPWLDEVDLRREYRNSREPYFPFPFPGRLDAVNQEPAGHGDKTQGLKARATRALPG